MSSSSEAGSSDNYEFDIIGMNCNSAAQTALSLIWKMLTELIREINFASEAGEVNYDASKLNRDFINGEIRKLGFDVSSEDEEYETELLKKQA